MKKQQLGRIIIALAAISLAACSRSSNSSSSFSSSSEEASSTTSEETSSSEEESSSSEQSSSSIESSSESSSSEQSSSEQSSSESSSSEQSSSSEEEKDDDYVEWIGNDAYPYYSTASTRLAMSLQAGWNVGNSLDAHHDSVNPESNYIDLNGTLEKGIQELDTETCYGNPKITFELMKKVKAAGFTTIRVPVSWHQHINLYNNFKISDAWMARVKTVVDQALSLGFKVILNTHHDIDPSFIYPDYAHIENSVNCLKSIWKQISAVFGGYSTDLIYEGFNEPRLTKESDPFNTGLNTEEVRTCINRLNQEFVNVIRSINMENEQKRFLMIKGYADSAYIISYGNAQGFVIPTDPSNRLLVSVHIYDPSEFAFHGTGGFDANDDTYTSHLRWLLDGLYQSYISKGIGVVVGEWGSVATSSNLNERIAHANYFVEQTYIRHIPCMYWDNGNLDGEAFALFDRNKETVVYQDITYAINNHWEAGVNQYMVSYYNGNTLISQERVKEGKTALGPSLPWGYGYDGLYYDYNCTNKFSLDNKITGDLQIYLSNYGVRPSYTLEADNDWNAIDSQYTYASNGAWYCTCPGKGKSNNYETQVNFVLPLLDDDSTYKIKFAYQITGSDASYLIYNDDTGNSVTSTESMNNDMNWHDVTIEFSSSKVTYQETRLTFSLASVPTYYSSINFGIKDISISKK